MMNATAKQAFDLSQERVLITGGGTGLGFGMAQCFIGAGAQVILTGRREDVLQDAARALDGKVSYYVHDVTDFEAASQLIASIEAAEGHVTTLINNAGHHVKKSVEETSLADVRSILDTHLLGAFALTQAVIPGMKTMERGNIIFIASMASLFGIPKVVAYAAAKAGALGMVRTLATELSPKGIRVNAIAPGWIQTPIFLRTVANDPERRDKILSRTPLNMFGEAEDVGWAAVYLCSPAARFMTGVCLPVDGGVSIGF